MPPYLNLLEGADLLMIADLGFELKLKFFDPPLDTVGLFNHLYGPNAAVHEKNNLSTSEPPRASWKSVTEQRKEAFLGRIVGSDVLTNKEATRPQQRSCAFKGKNYTINDYSFDPESNKPCGVTQDIPFSQLETYFDGERLVSGVLDFLAHLLPHSSVCKTRLQCNINIYTSKHTMSLHRDDRDLNLDTFDPAAVTCILYADGMRNSEQKQAGFELYGNPSKTGLFECWQNRDSDEAFLERRTRFLQAYEWRPGVLIGVTGNAYKLGLHSARPGWRGADAASPFERISLNFRLVRDDAWHTLITALAPAADV